MSSGADMFGKGQLENTGGHWVLWCSQSRLKKKCLLESSTGLWHIAPMTLYGCTHSRVGL